MKPEKNLRPVKAKATIHEVAKQAGVSISSVSRVLNNYPGIHPDLRERVERAIQDLNYTPSPRRRRQEAGSRQFCFLLTNRNLQIPFHSRMLQAIESECSRSGDLLVFRTVQYTPETSSRDLGLSQFLKAFQSGPLGRDPDGVILTGPTYPNLLEALESAGVAYVLLANNYAGPGSPGDAVGFDARQGTYEAIRYLIDLGHRQILFIGDTSLTWYGGQYEGYLQALSEAGLKPVAQVKTVSDSYYSNGYLSVEIAWEESSGVTAIFAGYDEIAMGAWKALNDRNIHVPRDVSLIGFDDEDYAAFTTPPLTTVRVNIEDLGRELIGLLYRKLENAGARLPAVTLDTSLIKRGTCRPLQQLGG